METLRETSVAETRFVAQSGGRGQYAHVLIRVEPNSTQGYELVKDLPEGAIPGKYFEAIDKGIRYALAFGAAGHEMVDVKVTLCDGSYHEGDSEEASFETAGFMAIKDALRRASPVLLEPIISLQIIVPADLTGVVVSDLKSRGADVIGVEGDAGDRLIRAIAPLSEMIGYPHELSLVTRERATYVTGLLCYRPCRRPPFGRRRWHRRDRK